MKGLRRFLLAAPVRRLHAPDDREAGPPTAADAEALAQLMLDAYRGTVDDEGETLDDSRALVAQYFAGAFGQPLLSVSGLTRREGRLVSATLLTHWFGGPFVAFMLTAPEAQRQGLARAGLARAFDRLAAGDEPWLRLVVTEGNRRAEALYESFGFVPVPRPAFTADSGPPRH